MTAGLVHNDLSDDAMIILLDTYWNYGNPCLE